MSIEAAVRYSAKHGNEATVIMLDDEIAAEEYGNGFNAEKAHALYSGTKSFWGPLAIRAEEDGLLRLDENVAETIDEWRDDVAKRQITVRMLLSLTAGFGFGGLGSAVPPYERAIATPLKNTPGATFTYGGVPLQIFGALLSRKLEAASLGDSPHEYLMKRLLAPARVDVASWRILGDGTKPLPTGAFLTAREWLRYGSYVAKRRDEFAACFQASEAHGRYGLGWWLDPEQSFFYASGSGGQGLYIIPAQDLVAVHFGKSSSYRHPAFLKSLLN